MKTFRTTRVVNKLIPTFSPLKRQQKRGYNRRYFSFDFCDFFGGDMTE
jgi:hypothetical protein